MIAYQKIKFPKKFSQNFIKSKIETLKVKDLANKALLSDKVGTEASIISKVKSTRKLVHSFQLNFAYKGFYANTTLTGKFGMQVMQSYRSFADNFTQNYTSGVFDRWHGEGTSNTMPRLSSVSNRNTNFISDIFMHDADYVRINNLTVGYEFGNMLENFAANSNAKIKNSSKVISLS